MVEHGAGLLLYLSEPCLASALLPLPEIKFIQGQWWFGETVESRLRGVHLRGWEMRRRGEQVLYLLHALLQVLPGLVAQFIPVFRVQQR